MHQVHASPDCDRVAGVVRIDALQQPEWDRWLADRPDGCFFHTCAWARVLHETYGHQPVYFSRIEGGGLQSLLPVMEVSSPVTGRRGVSLPFTDYCPPLTGSAKESEQLYAAAMAHGREGNWRYFECRSRDGDWTGASPSLFFYGHVIDLGRSVDALFKGLEGAVRRGVRKAESSGLAVEFSATRDAMRVFYRLHCGTRRRHGVPPQPVRFFENISRYVLEPGHGFVGLARMGDRPVAGAVFFHHGREAIYKFGASDYGYQQLRPNNLLMWEAMKRYAAQGCLALHLGRTSLANEGLRRFKQGFGSHEERLCYYRYHFGKQKFVTDVDRSESWRNWIFRCLPSPILRLAGALLYPHLS
jgi:hypothetical protein